MMASKTILFLCFSIPLFAQQSREQRIAAQADRLREERNNLDRSINRYMSRWNETGQIDLPVQQRMLSQYFDLRSRIDAHNQENRRHFGTRKHSSGILLSNWNEVAKSKENIAMLRVAGNIEEQKMLIEKWASHIIQSSCEQAAQCAKGTEINDSNLRGIMKEIRDGISSGSGGSSVLSK